MDYLVYDPDTTRILIREHGMTKTWKGKGFAKRAAEKAGLTNYAVAEVTDFHANIEKKVTRKNLMSGLEYEEPINTPLYLSPASETYWSM